MGYPSTRNWSNFGTVLQGDRPGPRLPFSFHALGGIGRLAAENLTVGSLAIDRLELEVTDLGSDPGSAVAERFQRRRTRLRSVVARLTAARLEERVEQVRRHLGGLGINDLAARLNDGYVSVRARVADGLAASELSFRVLFASAGTHLRALASNIRVHGHLPTPAPVLADRILVALLGAADAPLSDRPSIRGLCDVEIDVIGSLLWHLLPPAGWRLPAVADIELVSIRVGRAGADVVYGPAGTRTGELGVRPQTHQLAAAHDLMHSADQQLREGQLEEAMRGYRALLAAGGPEQPLLLERILAVAAARPAWFFDGLELARQALGRWPQFPAAHSALASITLAQSDAREAASHLTTLAQLASAEGDDDQAALAALAGARLLRVLEPRAATQLYQLALEHDPSSAEAADALADRYADELRWPELVRLVRARAVITSDPARAVQLRLRLADVFVHRLGDPASAQLELAAARELAPDDPAVHEMAAKVLSTVDRPAAVDAWREVARLAEQRGDHRTAARAWAVTGDMLDGDAAEDAWGKAITFDPLNPEALAGLATTAAMREDHASAADFYARLRGLGLSQQVAARYELVELARSLVAIGRADDARASLRRATLAGGEIAAEAHAVMAELAEAADDREHAAAALDTAIGAYVDLAGGDDGARLRARAAQLAVARAMLFDRGGEASAASADWQRAHELATTVAPQIARDAARTLLARAGDGAVQEWRWIDAVLATRPPATERATLLLRRAEVRRADVGAAMADIHEALAVCEDLAARQDGRDPAATALRRRAHELEAEMLAGSGDQRARAQALTAIAKLAERSADRVATENAAAAAWLAADEPAAALPHGARAHAELRPDVPPALRREVLVTLGEAAWRQRAWPDVTRAYRGLLDDPGDELPRVPVFRYRLAVAADRTGDPGVALSALRPLVIDLETARGTAPELRGQALRLYADLAERAGDLPGAAAALEGFAALAEDSSATARADAMYRAGELFRRAGDADEAVRCLETALKLSEVHVPALDTLELVWRDRGDTERVAVILGRKVAATARHPARQKPLLSRLGDLQHQLGRIDVALATHQRALEIDPAWRPSLAYVTQHLEATGQVVAAAGGYAQLAGELANDASVESNIGRDRHAAAAALAALVLRLDAPQLEAARDVARPALEHAAGDAPAVASALARVRGDGVAAGPATTPDEGTGNDGSPDEDTASGRARRAHGNVLSLREAAARARHAGKLADAFATLEAANHVSPGDPGVLQELVELALGLGDPAAAARHLTTLADLLAGARRATTLVELAEVYYDHLDDPPRGRQAMRAAADAFGTGARRDGTLRMLASEARAHLAWDVAVEALTAVGEPRRTIADVLDLATALQRGGRDAEAIALVEAAAARGIVPDAGPPLRELRGEIERKRALATTLDERARTAAAPEAAALREEAAWLRAASDAAPATAPPPTDAPAVPTPPPTEGSARAHLASIPEPATNAPSVRITGTSEETAFVVALAAHEMEPDDPAVLAALLAHLGTSEPALRREVLEAAARRSAGRALALALHELALLAREQRELIRAAAMLTRAFEVDPTYTPVWMPLADARAASDELDAARELYEQIAGSDAYDERRRRYAADRAEALGHDAAVVSGEIMVRPSRPIPVPDVRPELDDARSLAAAGDLPGAITIAERLAAALPADDLRALELIEALHVQAGDLPAAAEAIARQLDAIDDDGAKAILWLRRARLARGAPDREAEAYRCLQEAHACAPADPELAYELRTVAMVRGEWALAASLLDREIAASDTPRDRGALHLELALIFDEKLGGESQALANFEQALAVDPSIPAAKAPLARHYEAARRFAEAARLYEEAVPTARASERTGLARGRAPVPRAAEVAEPGFPVQVENAESSGQMESARALAHQAWAATPGDATAFRILAQDLRAAGDLPGLTELATVRARHATTGAERSAAWLEVARLADELELTEPAIAAYDEALAAEPTSTSALEPRGGLAFRRGDFATAERIYRELAPTDSSLSVDELALRRSIIAEQRGQIGDAISFVHQAASAAPMRRDVMMRLQDLATRTGDLVTALSAARAVLDLVPLDDEDATLAAHAAIVELLRQSGQLETAATHLERVLREHPHHGPAIEALASIHSARGDWAAATRYLFQLVPLAPTAAARAERLYQLGEVVLGRLGDVERADDVFLRASDVDPAHVPTLRRLLDVYWRADDPAGVVDIARDLASRSALVAGAVDDAALARALVSATVTGDGALAARLRSALGAAAPARTVAALGELADRTGRLQLAAAAAAVRAFATGGGIELAALQAAAVETAVAAHLGA